MVVGVSGETLERPSVNAVCLRWYSSFFISLHCSVTGRVRSRFSKDKDDDEEKEKTRRLGRAVASVATATATAVEVALRRLHRWYITVVTSDADVWLA